MPGGDSAAHLRYCLDEAARAKDQGNAALQSGQLRSAIFFYKKVYLHLAEYLPTPTTSGDSVAASGPFMSASNHSSDDSFVQGLCKQRGLGGDGEPSQRRCYSILPPQDQLAVVQLYVASLNNAALAHLKQQRYAEGAHCATQLLHCLELDVTLAGGAGVKSKALLRRGHCRVGLHELKLAEEDADEAHTLMGELGAPGDLDFLIAELRRSIDAQRRADSTSERRLFSKMLAGA